MALKERKKTGLGIGLEWIRKSRQNLALVTNYTEIKTGLTLGLEEDLKTLLITNHLVLGIIKFS